MCFKSRRFLTVGVYVVFFSATTPAQTVTSVEDFRSGPGSGLYSFASSTPATVLDLIQSGRPRPAATAQGELVLPPSVATAAKLPAVVLVHGAGGVYPEQVTYWAKLLNDQGIAAFVVDVFGPRGVKSTGEDQSQVPFVADTADSFAALGLLASHPRIDPKRIAVMGFSRGGITAVRSGVLSIITGSAPSGLRFAAHVALYSGGCAGALAVTPKPGAFSPEPMLFVHGDADDYTYMSDCRSYAQRIAAVGTPTEFVVLPGARHKFDVDNSRRINLPFNTKTKEGCPLEYDLADFKMRDRRSGEALSQDKAKEIGRERCADKGASMEGDSKAREAAAKAVMAFLIKSFK
ncbi:dienelactone hydrolase family protein [Rhodoferax sp.]|uniref:dienelactone hydrolase family protein n=1 Tax=Rhodoferax sp. TaxID=50421 RepID=UPI00274D1C3F|nr:dienelactone hydrolase family protein [Rhodoferax sp.]